MTDVFEAREAAKLEAANFLKNNIGLLNFYVTVSGKNGEAIACKDEQTALNCDLKYVFKCIIKKEETIIELYKCF